MEEQAKTGKIVAEKSKYFLTIGRQREEITPEMVGGEATLKELVGQEVELFYSEPKSFVVGLKPIRRPPILCYLPAYPWIIPSIHMLEAAPVAKLKLPHIYCYIPAPELIKGVEVQVQKNLADEFLKAEIISKAVHTKIVGG